MATVATDYENQLAWAREVRRFGKRTLAPAASPRVTARHLGWLITECEVVDVMLQMIEDSERLRLKDQIVALDDPIALEAEMLLSPRESYARAMAMLKDSAVFAECIVLRNGLARIKAKAIKAEGKLARRDQD